MDNNDDDSDLAGLLFGYIMYREIRDGRLEVGDLFRAGCILTLVVGAILAGLLVLAGALTPRYGQGVDRPILPSTLPAYVAPATTPPAHQPPTATPQPTVEPTSTPMPTALPGIGDRVPAGGGWAVTVTKVERWRPSWFDEPGWRLITAYLKVRMPAVEAECVWGSMFSLKAASGETYSGFEWERLREPELFDCSDYHRPTTAEGWVTFEIRGSDATGLVMQTCLGAYLSCEEPATKIRLP